MPTNLKLFILRGQSEVSLEEEKNWKSGFFGSPLILFFKIMQEFVQVEVSNFITNNGANDDICHLKKVVSVISFLSFFLFFLFLFFFFNNFKFLPTVEQQYPGGA